MNKKREWVRPIAEIEQFTANEYVAACGDTEFGKYMFDCDAPEGPLYFYRNGNATYLGNYHPCSFSHKTAASSEFLTGFVDYNENSSEDTGEAVIVCIEYYRWGRNAHATTKLDREQWETTKS